MFLVYALACPIVALQINQSFEVVAYLKRELRNDSVLNNNELKGNS